MKRAAIYCRSSKDRSDISIDVQRRALVELAAARGLRLAAEFTDAVESGKDEDRPGFQKLIAAVRDPRRGWDTILVHDTSRLARRRVLAIIFEEVDCKKHGIKIIYKSLPDADPITEMMLKSILQAMDEWHSLTSKQKGLAGMAENVRQGYRAGGRAPMGYKLRKIQTGAIRDGEPVEKSTLEKDAELSHPIATYLRLKAEGVGGKAAAQQSGLKMPASTLVGIEWNAIQYAGHTVWNVHAERDGNGYIGGAKRRPRSEWVIQRNTHEALIDDEAAERILSRLEANAGKRAADRRTRGDALLSGLLVTPDGNPWHREGPEYRQRQARRSIMATPFEDAILERVYKNLSSPDMAGKLVAAVRATLASPDNSEQERVATELDKLEHSIERQMLLAAEMTTPAPALRVIEQLEGKRAELAQRVAALDREAEQARMAANIREPEVQRLLEMALRSGRDNARELLVSVVERIELDPDTLHAVIFYRIGTGPPSNGQGPPIVPVLSSNPPGDANLTPAYVLRLAVGFTYRRHTGIRRCAK